MRAFSLQERKNKMGKVRYANVTEKEELKKLQQKAIRKIRGMQRFRPGTGLESFGFSAGLLAMPKRLSFKKYSQLAAQLKEFTSKKYHLINVGTQYDKEYVTSTKIDEVKEILRNYNLFVTMRQRALRITKRYYYGLDQNGKLVKIERETPFAQTEEGSYLRPVQLSLGTGKKLGYRERAKVPQNKLFITQINITSAKDVERFISSYSWRATTYGAKRIQQMQANFIQALKKNISTRFGKQIEKLLKELHVDPIEFQFLFDTTEAFTFDFIYDETITLEQKTNEIRSEIENLRDTKENDEEYKEYRRIVEEYESSLDKDRNKPLFKEKKKPKAQANEE